MSSRGYRPSLEPSNRPLQRRGRVLLVTKHFRDSSYCRSPHSLPQEDTALPFLLNIKDNPWWGICYCGFYDDPRSEQERKKIPNAQMENRKQRGEYIQSGKAHGLLAYLGQCGTTSRLLESPGTSGRSGGERFCRID